MQPPRFRFYGDKQKASSMYMLAWNYLERMKALVPNLPQKGPFLQEFSDGTQFRVQEVFGQPMIEVYVPVPKPVEEPAPEEERKGTDVEWIAFKLIRSDGLVVTPASLGMTETKVSSPIGVSVPAYEGAFVGLEMHFEREDSDYDYMVSGWWLEDFWLAEDVVLKHQGVGATSNLLSTIYNSSDKCPVSEVIYVYNPSNQFWYVYYHVNYGTISNVYGDDGWEEVKHSPKRHGEFNLFVHDFSELNTLRTMYAATDKSEKTTWNSRWYLSDRYLADSGYPTQDRKEVAVFKYSYHTVFLPYFRQNPEWSYIDNFHNNPEGSAEQKQDIICAVDYNTTLNTYFSGRDPELKAGLIRNDLPWDAREYDWFAYIFDEGYLLIYLENISNSNLILRVNCSFDIVLDNVVFDTITRSNFPAKQYDWDITEITEAHNQLKTHTVRANNSSSIKGDDSLGEFYLTISNDSSLYGQDISDYLHFEIYKYEGSKIALESSVDPTNN